MQDLKKHIASFFPFAQKQLGFKRPPKLFFVNDKQNAGDALGKTAYYEPETETIKIYVTNRHPKDVLRSFSHELVHHAQNCRGDFDNDTVTEEGYAQNDPHLREMEREAYEKGNMIFRDYCDGLTNNGGLEQMSMTEEKLREAVRAAIQRLAEKRGHLWTTVSFVVFGLFWLIPLAWVTSHYVDWQYFIAFVAVSPLLAMSIKYRVGLPA